MSFCGNCITFFGWNLQKDEANGTQVGIAGIMPSFYAACELLAKNPRLGHRRPDLTGEPVLFWPVRGQYMVIYLSYTEPLMIVRILQGTRNASAQL
jgi:hypothetical protein